MVKKLLSIQYPMFLDQDLGEINFASLGFKVYRVDIAEYNQLELIDQFVQRDFAMRLDDFDAVLIIDADILPFEESLLFPPNEIASLKSRLKEISKAKSKNILLFAMNGSIPIEYYQAQAALFDGLLICLKMPDGKYQEVMQSLSAFAKSD